MTQLTLWIRGELWMFFILSLTSALTWSSLASLRAQWWRVRYSRQVDNTGSGKLSGQLDTKDWISGTKSNRQSAARAVPLPQLLILEPTLPSVPADNPHYGMDSTFCKFLDYTKLEEWLVHNRVRLLFRGALRGWKNSPEGNILSFSEGKPKSCVWDGIIPYNGTGLELTG